MTTIHITAHVAPKAESVVLKTSFGEVTLTGEKEALDSLLLDMSVNYGEAYFSLKNQGYEAWPDGVWANREVFRDAREKLSKK